MVDVERGYTISTQGGGATSAWLQKVECVSSALYACGPVIFFSQRGKEFVDHPTVGSRASRPMLNGIRSYTKSGGALIVPLNVERAPIEWR